MSPPAQAAVRLSDGERLAWLRLIRSENIGPVTFRELIRRFGTAGDALAAVPELARRGGRRIRIASPTEAERELAAVTAAGARLIAISEPEYPTWLGHIDDAPPLVSVRGDPACLARPIVAIVGSRNASVAGRKFAMLIAAGLGERGYVIASGLARGIDAAAHEAAISTGTVAVYAGGLDRLFPPENAALATRIIEGGGAHLTEMPMGWEPRARDFPRRNRIVAGLALGVVIVEAARQSGSLITARLAAEQGRLVFAVPGSPLDPRATGANQLIRDGAHIVTEVEDIVSALSPMFGGMPEPARTPGVSEGDDLAGEAEDADRAKILEALGPTPVAIDEIIRFTGLRPALVHLLLVELSLAGRIERHPGQRVSMITEEGRRPADRA
jgi:DNA processing protein